MYCYRIRNCIIERIYLNFTSSSTIRRANFDKLTFEHRFTKKKRKTLKDLLPSIETTFFFQAILVRVIYRRKEAQI